MMHEQLRTAALAQAERHNLLQSDGTVKCWTCGNNRGQLPSLHCQWCLDRMRREGRIKSNPASRQLHLKQAAATRTTSTTPGER